MHTGSEDSLHKMGNRSHKIAEQIASLLNEAEAIMPGSVTAHSGQIGMLEVCIRKSHADGWKVQPF